MPEVETGLAELKTEVRYLKWIIPSACGFVAILILIFWGIERKNIGDKVRAAIQDAGVKAALQEAQDAASAAIEQKMAAETSAGQAAIAAGKAEESARKALGEWEKLGTDRRWPHAMNCGSSWEALFVLHGNPAR